MIVVKYVGEEVGEWQRKQSVDMVINEIIIMKLGVIWTGGFNNLNNKEIIWGVNHKLNKLSKLLFVLIMMI